MAVTIANFYEDPHADVELGHLQGTWRDMGRQVGSRRVGLRRIEVKPGGFSTPAHEHGGDEEIFFLLAGDGLLWQDGKTFAVAAGDCIVHRPKGGAHTLRAGPDGLDVLVYGHRADASLTALPRAGVAWSFPRWVELPGGDTPFAREAAAGPPECPEPTPERPAHVVALQDVEPVLGGRVRTLGMAGASAATGLNHVLLAAGESGAPLHCHSAEEELFVVLEGTGTLLLRRGDQPAEEQPLRAGDVVSRPAGTGVAHALRAGEQGLTYLAYGTRDPNDICFYPESGRVSFRGLGIALSSPQIDYL